MPFEWCGSHGPPVTLVKPESTVLILETDVEAVYLLQASPQVSFKARPQILSWVLLLSSFSFSPAAASATAEGAQRGVGFALLSFTPPLVSFGASSAQDLAGTWVPAEPGPGGEHLQPCPPLS